MPVWGWAAAGSLAVTGTTLLARRGGRWAGLLAAAPVTPTLAFLAVGGMAPGTALRGLATVAAALLGLVAATRLGHRAPWASPVLLVAAATPLAVPFLHVPPSLLAALILLLAALCRTPQPDPAGSGVARPRMPLAVAFVAGALALGAVGVVRTAWPEGVGVIAVVPALLLCSLAVAEVQRGRGAAQQVASGAAAASVGVAAFVAVLALPADAVPGAAARLVLAWAAFLAVTASWGQLARLVRGAVGGSAALHDPLGGGVPSPDGER